MNGERIADRVLHALRLASDEQLVVANDPRAARWFPGLPVARDAEPGLGPLAGIATALHAARGAPVLVVAWDMPWVTDALLRALRARGEGGATAVVPVHGPGAWPEPLCAWYAPGALHVCRSLLAAGERRAGALLTALPGVATLTDAELAPYGDPARLFESVDTPEALEGLGGTLETE